MVVGTLIGMITGIILPVITGRTIGTVILDSINLVVHGMATSAARQGVARDKAADVMSKIQGGPVATRHVSPPQHGKVLTIMDIGCIPITLCGIAQISPPRRTRHT